MLQLCLVAEKTFATLIKTKCCTNEEKNSLLKCKYGAHQHEYIIQNMYVRNYLLLFFFSRSLGIFSSFSSSNFNNFFFLVQM